MNKNKGFTLIELLVVIAIIGILASVVLASLNSARAKGANAAVKSNLANMRSQAEIVYDNATPNSYSTLCANTNVVDAVAAAETAAGVTAGTAKYFGDDDSWVVVAPLKVAEDTDKTHYCVDSTGKSAGVTTATFTATTTADTLCS